MAMSIHYHYFKLAMSQDSTQEGFEEFVLQQQNAVLQQLAEYGVPEA